MDEDVVVAAPAPVAEPTSKETFTIEFQIPEHMLATFARIGLEVVMKQRMNEIEESVKK